VILLGLLGTIATDNAFIAIFIVYFSLDTVVWYAFDLVIEHYSREQVTGNIRGIYLTLNNAGWVTAPVVASVVVAYAGFSGTYLVASVVVLISLSLIATTTTLPATYRYTPQISLLDAFRALVSHKQARRIVAVYFVIQFFYALMVIYMAPYLLNLGFSWNTIGIIFSIMLLPYVLLQYWGGKIADRFHAEKKLILWGFVITALGTALLAFPIPPIAAIFAAILFLTRIGASIIEIGCESAFFKEVTDRDTALIGTLRMTLPLAYIIAPLGGALLLSFGSTRFLFGALAGVLVVTVGYAFRLKKQ
jgi:MFS family permease